MYPLGRSFFCRSLKDNYWDEDNVRNSFDIVDGVTDDLFNDVVTEFDDSPEADMIRKCDEADRTGEIPECTWVRTY